MKRKMRVLALVSGLMAAAIMFIGCTVDVHDNPTSANLPSVPPVSNPPVDPAVAEKNAMNDTVQDALDKYLSAQKEYDAMLASGGSTAEPEVAAAEDKNDAEREKFARKLKTYYTKYKEYPPAFTTWVEEVWGVDLTDAEELEAAYHEIVKNLDQEGEVKEVKEAKEVER